MPRRPAAGASAAVNDATDNNSADVERDLNAGGAVTVTADSAQGAGATARAGAHGPKPSGNTTAQKQAKSLLSGADPGNPDTAEVPAAQTSDGAVGIAAALGLNLASSTALATVGPVAVTAAGPLTVGASDSASVAASGDGSAVTDKAGIGVGVGINLAGATGLATIAPGAVVQAHGLALTADNGSAGTNTFMATATSGAGGTTVGVAGSFALNNVTDNSSSAILPAGASVDAMGGDVAVLASDQATIGATANAAVTGTGKVGVGASVALVLAKSNTADAEVQDGAALADAGNLTNDATSTQTETAGVEAGSAGGIAVTPAAAVIVSSDTTTARLGTAPSGAAALGATGDVSLTATHTGSATSMADATAAGGQVAVGAAAAVNDVTDNTSADVERALNAGGAVTVAADSAQGAEATAKAGAHGPKPSAGTSQGQAESLLSGDDPGNTDAAEVPAATTSDGAVSFAAALGLNLASSEALATVGAVALTAAGPLTVGASDSASVAASGDGSAVTPDPSIPPAKAGIGVGVAINVAGATGLATIAPGAVVLAHGLALTADSGAGGGSSFTATATSGAAGTDVGVAGSFAFNLVTDNSSTALIQGGASVDAGGGDVTIGATNTSTAAATALPAGHGAMGGKLGVGASLALNVLTTNTADAEAQDSSVLTNAGAVTVSATGTHTVTTKADNGASGGKVGIAAGVGVAIVTNNTTARLGTSASTLSATGAVTVTAANTSTATTTTDGATTGGYADQDATAQAITSQMGGYKGKDASSTRVMNAVNNASTTVQQTAPTNQTSSALGASVTPEGASASVRGSALVSAGHNVQVLGNALVGLNLVAGAGALGVAGVGGSVVVAHIASQTNAYAEPSATVAAATSDPTGNVVVHANFVEAGPGGSNKTLTGKAYAGSGGLVGLGAQWVEINDDSQTNASLKDGANVTNANQVTVRADASRIINADTFGVQVGLAAAGAAVAKVNVNGQTTASTGTGVQIGEQPGQNVQSLSIIATNTTGVTTRARAIAAGIGAGSGNVANSEIRPTIQASIGPNSQVLVGQNVLVSATSTGGATANVFGVQAGAVAVGVSVADATMSPTVKAYIDSGAHVTATTGAITAQANDTENNAQSSGSATGVSAGTGQGAKITATAAALLDSHIGSNAIVNAGQTVSVLANGGNSASATASTLSVGILLNVAAIFATATAGGHDSAYLDSGAVVGGAPALPLVAGTGNASGAVVGTAVQKAGGLDVEATGSDGSHAQVDLSGGGAFSGQGGNATANTNPIIDTHISDGSSVNVTGDVTVQSNSQTGGAANTQGASGGIVDVRESLANTNLTPTITTYVGQATINAGGKITVDSVNGAPRNVSIGAFTPAQVQNNAISFVDLTNPNHPALNHNLVTGDTVTYLQNGNPPIGNNNGQDNQNPPVRGLANGRVYSVFVVSPTQLELGATFDASNVNLTTDTIYFPNGVNLQNGTEVIYQDNGQAPIGGLNNNQHYYVRVVDAQHIKLLASPDDFNRGQYLLSNNGDYSPTHYFPFSVSTPFKVGDPITYAPRTNVNELQVVTITANQISESTIGLKGMDGNPISIPYRQGQALIYRTAEGATPIGGLTPIVGPETQQNPHYYYAIVDGLPKGAFKLSATRDGKTPITLDTSTTLGYQTFTRADKEIGGLVYGDTYLIAGIAGGNLSLKTLDGQIVHPFNQGGQSKRDEDGTIGVQGIHFTSKGAPPAQFTANQVSNSVINLPNNPFTSSGQPVIYSPGPNATPIGGLTPGHTYYVIRIDANHFQLSAIVDKNGHPGAPIPLDTTNTTGAQLLKLPPQALILPLDMTGTKGTYELLGVGNSVNSPAGAGFAQAGATGSGGGLVEIGGSTANVTSDPKVNTYVGTGANLTATGDILIASTSTVNTTANGSNNGGGFVAVGGGNANVTLINDNRADVNGGATITTTQGNFTLQATSRNNVLASSDSFGGGFVGISKPETIVNLIPKTEASVGNGATITAQKTLSIVTFTNTTANAVANGSGGGLGVNASSHADIFMGADPFGDDPSNFTKPGHADPAYSQTTIGGATLTGQDTTVQAVTSYSLTAVTNAEAFAFGAETNATSATDSNDYARVSILTGAKIAGTNSVDIEARHDNVFLLANAQSGAHAFAGTANSFTFQDIFGPGGVNVTGDNNYSQVEAAHGATITTPNLTVKALALDPATHLTVCIENNTYGGFLVGHNDHIESALTATRGIQWNADVASATAAPSLPIVNADGTVDPRSTIKKPTITATQIIVPDIRQAGGGGTITFVANQVQLPPTPGGDFKDVTNKSGDGFITSTAAPNFHTANDLPTFFEVTTAGSIQILNYSTKDLVVGNIDVLNRGSTSGRVDINVKSDGLDAVSSPVPFHFKTGTAVAPTLVDIENRNPVADPNIILTGLINNPIGTTEILNPLGSILSASPQAIVRSNILDVEAANGDIGSGANALSAQLVQSEDVNKVKRPIQATVLAGGSAYLNLKGVLRDPDVNLSQTPFTVPLQSIHAGGDVVVTLQGSERDTSAVGAGGSGGVTVFEDYTKVTTQVFSFFRPDQGPSASLDPGFFEGGVAPIDAVYNFADVTAGHNINFRGLPFTNTIQIQANTNINPNGNGTGHIDASTSGNITITETAGAMRVGSIQSTKGSVALTVPDLPTAGQDLVVLDNGQVSALGTILMQAGDNVSIPASSSLAALLGVTIRGGHNDQDTDGGATIDVLGRISAAVLAVYAESDNDVVNFAGGQNASPLLIVPIITTVYAQGSNDTINVRNNSSREILAVQSPLGPTTINVGSTAGLTGQGSVDGIVGAVTVMGGGGDTLNASDQASTANNSGTLTDTRLTGLGMGQGITYSGLANLNIYLGGGNNTSNTFAINEINPATTTFVEDSGLTDSVTATFQQDFQGILTLQDFKSGTVQVNRDFVGTLDYASPGNRLDSVSIGRSLTGSCRLVGSANLGTPTVGGVVNNQAVPGDVFGTVGFANLDSGFIYGSLDGEVDVGNITHILEVFGDMMGKVHATGDVAQMSVLGSLSTTQNGAGGKFTADGNVTLLEVGAVNSGAKVLIGGDLSSLHVADLSKGRVVVGGSLRQAQIDNMQGVLAVGGDVGQGVVGAGGSLTRSGGIVTGFFGGQLVVMGNVYGDLLFKDKNFFNGRIAVQGHAVAGLAAGRFGILGNVEIDAQDVGTVLDIPAIVSGGLIGDKAGGTNVSVPNGALFAILAAKGAIAFGNVANLSPASIFQQAQGLNAAAIDALFTDMGRQLVINPFDLNDLGLILADLAALHVGSDGNLTGPIP
jgi:hypothetical protein